MRIHICIYIGISAAPFLTPSPTLYPQAEDTRQQAATDSQSMLLWGSELLRRSAAGALEKSDEYLVAALAHKYVCM